MSIVFHNAHTLPSRFKPAHNSKLGKECALPKEKEIIKNAPPHKWTLKMRIKTKRK
jgi:hypothetical protein